MLNTLQRAPSREARAETETRCAPKLDDEAAGVSSRARKRPSQEAETIHGGACGRHATKARSLF